MNRTTIGWCTHTVNPIRAQTTVPASASLVNAGRLPGHDIVAGCGHYCEKVSAGCANCYASRLQARFGMPPFHEQRAGKRDGRIQPYLDRAALTRVLRARKPARIFWCMTDLFGAWVPDEWLDRIFATMALTPQHTHLVLTKRPERMRMYLQRLAGSIALLEAAARDLGHTFQCRTLEGRDVSILPWPIPSIYLGVSIEDPATAAERILPIFDTPARLRFVSYEPALRLVDFRDVGGVDVIGALGDRPHRLDWIIVGGESGPGARPCDVAWIRSVVAQGRAAGVPVYVKQLGAIPQLDGTPYIVPCAWGANGPKNDVRGGRRYDRKHSDPSEWPPDLRVRELPA